jgi:hypothetical protein
MLWIARHLLRALRALRRAARPAPVVAGDRMSLDCPSCTAPFLCPMDWGTVDDERWWVLSRCGECGHWTETLVANEQAKRLDLELNRQQAFIRRAADRLEAERMAVEADAFIVALQHDLIDAGDFA